jgi:iduronate 2-sulfatase
MHFVAKACALFFILVATASAAEPVRPNVLLICVDDLKPALGCYGDPLARTPNVDRLAKRGLLFRSAYCNQAVCSPSRNALLTGFRPQTLGIYDLGTNFRKALPDAVTLPQYFKQHGYRAEALGKIFHVGHGNHEDPASWSVPHWKSNVVAYALPESRAKRGLTREEALFSNQPAGGLSRGAPYENADVADDAYPDGAMATEVIKRLERAKDEPEQPWFMAVGFVKPHLPFCAPKKYWEMHDATAFKLAEIRQPPKGAPKFAPQFGGELRQYRDVPDKGPLSDELQRQLIHGYYAATSYMDAQLGRVLDTLDETGLAKNTIIVLWGDHGWHLGDHGMWCKHTNYEQATHIPLIIVTPDNDAARETKAIVESVDLYPTLAELVGLPERAGLDGKSLISILKNPESTVRDYATHVYPRGNRIGRAVRTAQHRLVEWKEPKEPADEAIIELYDYASDPLEQTNVAKQHPNVVTKLRSLLAQQPDAKEPLKN